MIRRGRGPAGPVRQSIGDLTEIVAERRCACVDEMIIRKETVAVELCAHGAVARGEVFLRAPGEGSDRGERLLDVLAERWFVPLKTPEKLVFVATRHVAWARIDLLSAVDEL